MSPALCARTQCGSGSGARLGTSTRPDQRRTVGARAPRDVVTCHAEEYCHNPRHVTRVTSVPILGQQ